MRQVTAAGNRFRQAHGLPAVLDAACDAFEAILTVIGDYEDTTSTGAAITFLLVATQAANGRDALLFAPSLPPRALHPMAAAGEHGQRKRECHQEFRRRGERTARHRSRPHRHDDHRRRGPGRLP